ncbi:derlin-3 [Limosa lapponica baueri]|uniref:Derlin-3 n=1 Tax=Limosa lapponica baueri TaxID=1758121 RepID=A0A2I0TD78_LIMLA|nr:derlin-3 [Limosa lapponica baueri]
MQVPGVLGWFEVDGCMSGCPQWIGTIHVMGRDLSVHLLFSLLSLLFQIWRLITNFLFFGPLGFSFFFNMIFLYPLVLVKLSAPFLA